MKIPSQIDFLDNYFSSQNLNFCQITDFEPNDRESLSIIKKKNDHFFRLLFMKYSNSTNQSGIRLFQAFRPSDEIIQTLSISDLRKMLKDFSLDSFIKKEVCEYIYMKINEILIGEKGKKPLFYDGFIDFLIQISRYIFTKEPFDFGDRPLGILLEELINLMWKSALLKNNKEILLMFSNDKKAEIRLQIMNNILKEHPESELPDVFLYKI